MEYRSNTLLKASPTTHAVGPEVTDAAVHVGYISLMPGAWALHKDLPVLQSGVDALTTMGVRMIRFGGTSRRHYTRAALVLL